MDLKAKAKYLRRQSLELMAQAQKGHIGGSFSCMDILVALYYGGVMKYDPQNPEWEDRDRFIMSKGHTTLALYPLLADVGYFDKKELENYCTEWSIFEGHPNKEIPGIEIGTGSLGQGLGIGAGMALAAKMDNKDYKTFVLMGDGECYEGSVWEAAQFAAHHKLSNLTVIIDRNKQCVTDFTEDCNGFEPLKDKWEAFGWSVYGGNPDWISGHDIFWLVNFLEEVKGKRFITPYVIIADTIKGKGVSFMEGKLEWHNKLPTAEELEQARRELET